MAYKFNENFIGYRENRRYELFSGSDSKQLFEENLKTKPDDWYYRTNKIEYKRNSLGHRCNELAHIDLDNYILTIGCSHTEGSGLSIENTYSHMLSKKMNCDYYNLALAGTGIDTMMHNLTVWFSTVKKHPKLLVVQYPDVARFNTIDDKQAATNMTPKYAMISPWTINTPNLTRIQESFIILGEQIKYFDSKVTFSRVLLKALTSAPLIEVHVRLPHELEHQIPFRAIDEARDGHRGIMSNYVLAGNISKTYKALIS